VRRRRATREHRDAAVQRYYDPGTGQFMSLDPLNKMTNSGYSFNTDNPFGGSDPTGTIECGGGTYCSSSGADSARDQASANSSINPCAADLDVCLGPLPAGVSGGTPAPIAKPVTSGSPSCAGGTKTPSESLCMNQGATVGGCSAICTALTAVGHAGEWAVAHRGQIFTGIAVSACFGGAIIFTDGGATPVCVAATTVALGVRVQQRIANEGFDPSMQANALDVIFTGASLGLVTAPGLAGSQALEELGANAPIFRIVYASRMALPDIFGAMVSEGNNGS
jgi:hypothetical protein